VIACDRSNQTFRLARAIVGSLRGRCGVVTVESDIVHQGTEPVFVVMLAERTQLTDCTP